jgi:hypothetical protein
MMFGVLALTREDITKLMTSSLCTLVNCEMEMPCYYNLFFCAVMLSSLGVVLDMLSVPRITDTLNQSS